MDEFEEFASALLDQISVELNEEKTIKESQSKAAETFGSKIVFEDLETISEKIVASNAQKVLDFTGISVPESKIEFPDLV
ncbi:MAG: hypothetical protein KGI25_03685, partial [Thaumarchaeota archaeon]|nr:hypothetical protein [Nitrososphaerota archaeon]